MSRRHRRTKRRKKSRLDFLEAGVRIERSGGLIYVYLDTPEAIRIAPRFLPPTQRGVTVCGTAEVWVYRDPEFAA
jgi:hypothetical protein